MTNIVKFLTPPGKHVTQTPSPETDCEIVIFPGVRRERCEGAFEYPARASGTERSV